MKCSEFPWNKNWFAKDFMHGWVKFVIIKSGYLLIYGAGGCGF